MTPLDLQDALCDELKKVFKHHTYKKPSGERVPINIYPQEVPISQTDDEEDPIPYIIVRLNSGDDTGAKDSFNTVHLVIIVGVWDMDKEAQGHRDILNIFQKIYERFHKNPSLKGGAVYNGDFHWATQEDNYYPYYFGACKISFYVSAIRREDEFA